MSKHWAAKERCAFYTKGPTPDAFEVAAIAAVDKCALVLTITTTDHRYHVELDVEYVSAVYKSAIPKWMKGHEYITPMVNGEAVVRGEDGRTVAWVPNGAIQRTSFVTPDEGYGAVK